MTRRKGNASRRDGTLAGCLCAAGCEVLFGLSYLFTREAAGHASALALLGWRFLVATLALLLLRAVGVVHVRLKGKDLRPLLLVALFDPILYFVGETYGIGLTTASESGAFLACIPVASLVASALILHERPHRRQVSGILVTLAGVLTTVFAVGASSSLSVLGYLFLLVGVVSYALYSVFVRKAEGYTGMEITYVMLVSGAAVFGGLAVAEAAMQGSVLELASLPFRDASFLGAVLYQGIGCSVLAFFLSNHAIASIGVNRASSFIGLSTGVSIAAGVLLLGEPFSFVQLCGVVLILTGVYIANGRASA